MDMFQPPNTSQVIRVERPIDTWISLFICDGSSVWDSERDDTPDPENSST